MTRYAVLDFETTGMSPDTGARPTEIGLVLIEHGHIIDRFSSLMNPQRRIPYDITRLTGITNAMVATAPSVAEVMHQAQAFAKNAWLVAHNASFDQKFWHAESRAAGLPANQNFICSLLLSRRIFPAAPSHSLGKLVDYLRLPALVGAHRALADAEATAHLFLHQQATLSAQYQQADWPPEWLFGMQKVGRSKLNEHVFGLRSQAARRLQVGR